MKVLHVNTSKGWRGGERQTLLLAEGLAVRGCDGVLAAWPGSPMAKRAEGEGIAVVPVKPCCELDLAAAGRLRGLILAGNTDLVHAHTSHAHGIAALALLGLSRIPLVVTRRVQYAIRPNLLSRIKYRRCARIIAVSEHTRKVLVSDGIPPERITCVHSGIRLTDPDGSDVRSTVRSELRIGGNDLVVGTVAALTEEKGISILLRAFPAVLGEHPNARLVVVGDGPLRAPLEELARVLEVNHRLTFTGFREDVGRVLAALDVFAFPSLREGLGSSVLDAMHAGLPVVATRTGGIPEMVEDGETGFLFDRGDSTALARLLNKLAASPQRCSSMGVAARRKVREFGIERTIEATMRVYSEVLAARGRQ